MKKTGMLKCNPDCKLRAECVGLCPKWRMGCTKMQMTEEESRYRQSLIETGEDRCLGCLEVGFWLERRNAWLQLGR